MLLRTFLLVFPQSILIIAHSIISFILLRSFSLGPLWLLNSTMAAIMFNFSVIVVYMVVVVLVFVMIILIAIVRPPSLQIRLELCLGITFLWISITTRVTAATTATAAKATKVVWIIVVIVVRALSVSMFDWKVLFSNNMVSLLILRHMTMILICLIEM